MGHSGNTNGLLAERVHAGKKVFRSFYEHLISFFFLGPVRCFIAAGSRPTDCCESKLTTAAGPSQPAAHFPGSPLKHAGGQCLIRRASGLFRERKHVRPFAEAHHITHNNMIINITECRACCWLHEEVEVVLFSLFHAVSCSELFFLRVMDCLIRSSSMSWCAKGN